MNYNEALNFIEGKQRLGIKPGLSRVKKLLDAMGDPQNSFNIIHIAGTNGKGTVAHSVANAIKTAGYKVGLFTSPWVVDYREQIQINGKYIPENDFAEYISAYSLYDATEFELITAVAYKYFCDSGVDYAVVECGMGGAGDATNAAENTRVSVITSIALDHLDFLGNTIEEIAEQKAGIIKENGVCVLYPNNNTQSIFEKRCKEKNARLIKAENKGDYRLNNLAVANAVLNELGIYVPAQIPQIPARREIINGIMLDGSHNADAALALLKSLPDEKITAVIGMMRDKNADGYLSVIGARCKKIICVQPHIKRAMDCEALSKIAAKYCNNVISCGDPVHGVELLKRENGFRLICGSFYLAREIRKYLFI